jgi:hypothetical protein
MYDIIFASLPYSNLDQIYQAPAILKGVVIEHGFTAKTIDFGCELLKLCKNDVDKFYEVQNYFISPGPDNTGIISQFNDLVIDYFKTNPSRHIGISVFSIYTQKTVMPILERLRKELPGTLINVGGRGLNTVTSPAIANDLGITTAERFMKFGDVLKKRKLVDDVVFGDGEDAILSILNNTSIPESLADDYFKSSIPDYSDYKFEEYLFNDKSNIQLPITGSKGCVRDCDFCDVSAQFGRYRYRTGKDIANEMIISAQKYNVRKFQFTDSLVNGGLKPFEEFLTAMSEYNLQHPGQEIKWNGQYVCRPASQMPSRLYPLMASAGAEGLTIGAESGSNSVLEAMNKKTTVEALMYELEQFRKYNITCFLLLFVGHWSETWHDFELTCKMLMDITPYIRSGTVSAVRLGNIFYIIDGTPSANNVAHNQIQLSDFNRSQVWVPRNNKSNTFKERVYRRLIVDKLAKKLKIPTIADATDLLWLAEIINQQYEQINEFHKHNF